MTKHTCIVAATHETEFFFYLMYLGYVPRGSVPKGSDLKIVPDRRFVDTAGTC